MTEETLDITTLKEGAIVEQINDALIRCIANALDPNTEAKAKRGVNVKITLAPNEERDLCAIEVRVESRLPGDKGILTHATMGVDRHGIVSASEVRAANKNMDLPLADVTDIQKGK